MKKQLLKKLYALIFIITSSYTLSNAQIVYKNVIPDDTILCTASPCTSFVSLDLDNDGHMDFDLYHYSQYLGSCSNFPIKFRHRATVSTTANSFYNLTSSYPSAFNFGKIIDSNLTWNNGEGTLKEYGRLTCLPNGLKYFGNWIPGTDYYLPVKIIKSGNNYFGWIKMQIYNYGIILKGYAYNSTPNQFIIAGDSGAATYIAISSAINSPLCFGSHTAISYTFRGNFNNSNVFTAELSDSTGNFLNSTVIGSINSNLPGIINATIPQNISNGAGYRIRIRSSSPSLTGYNNGDNLVIYSSHAPVTINNLNNNDTICTYNPSRPLNTLEVQVSANMQSIFSYQWRQNGVDITSGKNQFLDIYSYQAQADTFQTFIYNVIVSDVCASDTSSPISVTVFPTIVKLDSFPDACLNDPPLILHGGSPPGGIYFLIKNGSGGSISVPINYSYYGTGTYGIYYESQTPDTFGCMYGISVTQYFHVNICAGIDENYSKSNFLVSAIDKKIIVQIDKNDFSEGRIEIYNSIGQEIKKVFITGNRTEIEMNKNSRGFYFITVQTNSSIETRKIYLN